MLRVVFFGDGDFPRETFKYLISNGSKNTYKIVGLVTSEMDRCEDKGSHLSEIAREHNIPVKIVHHNGWFPVVDISGLAPDIFIVISFKKLPHEVLDLVGYNAFNVHASLLPDLRGSNPIRWALRCGYTETGLTAIRLAAKIDHGGILGSMKVNIEESDNYLDLKTRLASECTKFTEKILLDHIDNDPYLQPQNSTGVTPTVAPKLNHSYHYLIPVDDPLNVLRSLAPYSGLTAELSVYSKETLVSCTEIILWGFHKATPVEYTLFNVVSFEGTDYIIDTIQMPGKKKMPFSDFARGFKYFKQPYLNTHTVEIKFLNKY